MRNTKRKLLASLLSVCLFVGLAVPVFAETKAIIEHDFGNRPTKTEDVTQKPEGGPEVIVYQGTDSDGKGGTHRVTFWCFLANGTPVTVTANKENSKKVDISYDGYTYTSPEYVETNTVKGLVTYRICIFGGGHNSTTEYESTSVTLESGEVFILSGGGLHGSKIGTANTVIKGGFAGNVYASGIGYGGNTSDGCDGGKAYDDDDRTLIDNAKLTINGGGCGIYCGGPMGYGHTKNATVTMSGGKVRSFSMIAGSNGVTDNAELKMTGGTNPYLLGTNHGLVGKLAISIDGTAEIGDLYILSDEVNKTECAKLSGPATVSIKGGKVKKLLTGANNTEPGTAQGANLNQSGIIKGEYKRSSVANYKDLLTAEAFGTAFADLLPIPESTKVDVTTSETKPEKIKEAVEEAVKTEIAKDDSTIKNGDTVVANTATVPDAASDAVKSMLDNVSNIPGSKDVQIENPSENDNKSGVLVSTLTEVETTEAGALTAVTFDVTPYIYTPAATGSTSAPSKLDPIKKPDKAITFYLPVPSDWSGWVDTYHNEILTGHAEIHNENGVNYVQLESGEFSAFRLVKSNYKPTPTPTPSYSSGGVSSEFYVTVIAGANGKAKEAEGFYARDERHTFTMIPDEGYVIDTVTLDDGSVLSHTDTEFVLFVDEPYEVHVTFKKAAGSTITAPTKPSASKNPQTGDNWFSGLF